MAANAALLQSLLGSQKPKDLYTSLLIKNGLDTSPVQHWSQGAARMVQALLGANELRGSEQEAEAALQTRMNAPGLGTGAPAPAPQQGLIPRMAQALMGGGEQPQPQQSPQQPSLGPIKSGPRPPNAPPAKAGREYIGGMPIYSQDEVNPLDLPQGEERDRLIRTVYGEAANQPPQGQQAVASVIRNRAASGRYGGDTVSGVVGAPNQFEPWNTPQGRARMASLSPNDPAYQRISQSVDRAYAGDDPTGGATHFYAPQAQAALGRQTPTWAKNQPSQGIGDHRFYRLGNGGAGATPVMAQGGAPAEGSPQAMPQSPNQPRAQVQIPPDVAAHIRQLYASRNPANIAQADALYQQYAKPREEVKQLVTPQDRARAGIDPNDSTRYQQDATGKISPINPQPFNVNVNNQQESEFRKKAGALTAERYNKIVEDGQGAQGMVADISALREIGGRITTGKSAEIKAALGPWAEAAGIKIDQLDDLQAYKAIVSRLAPRLRVPGSGAQSDFELKQFLESLPTLGNTPNGNTMIANTLEALQQHKIQAAEIASAAINGDITQKEADKQIRELKDPMTLWREFRKQSPVAPQGGGGSSGGPVPYQQYFGAGR